MNLKGSSLKALAIPKLDPPVNNRRKIFGWQWPFMEARPLADKCLPKVFLFSAGSVNRIVYIQAKKERV